MRFLIVDDSSTMRRIIINTLTKLGYESFLEAATDARGSTASAPARSIS